MKKTFLGGIRFRRKNTDYSSLKDAVAQSVTYEAESERMIQIKEGDSLCKGSIIFKEANGAPAIYCGINGNVEKISSESDKTSVLIKASDGEEEITLDPFDKTLGECFSEELLTGLVKMGVYPPKEGTKAVKVMTVDCGGSPHNSSRLFLCINYPKQVLGGAKILMKILGAKKCNVAIPTSCLDAAQEIEKNLVARRSVIKVALFKEKYPSAPQLTVRAVTNIEISAYKRPENSGYPVVTPHLCIAAYRALAEGVPLTEGFVSITDEKGVTRVASVPFGAKLNDVFPAPEGYKLVRAEKIMGKAVEDDDVMEYGVEALAVVKDVPYPAITERGCIGCRRCVNICPGRLLPYQLYNAAEKGKMSISFKNELLSCFECGCCSAVCPSCLPISELLSKARTEYIADTAPENTEAEDEDDSTDLQNENEDYSENDEQEGVIERITLNFDDDVDEDADVDIFLEINEENVEPVIEPITEEITAEPTSPSKNTGKKKNKKDKNSKPENDATDSNSDTAEPENDATDSNSDTAEPEKVDLASIFCEGEGGEGK